MNYFEYYNPNPTARAISSGKPLKWHKGDCTIRAICKASGLSWLAIFDILVESARKNFSMVNDQSNVERVLEQLGFEKVSYAKGRSRETVREFCRNHPDTTAVLRVANHEVCVSNGKYYDTWDCGNYTAYCYYVKP